MKYVKVPYFLAAFFVVVMAFFTTAFPLEPQHQVVSSVFVIFFALPCYFGLVKTFGLKKAVILILSMSLFALVLENFAISTGIPYGTFEYGKLIGSTIGRVPWTVGFAWTPILFGAAGLTQVLFQQRAVWVKILSIAVLMTVLDLVLDPGSVALSFWLWHGNGDFYGVPWTNFGGWVLTSAIAAVLLLGVLKILKISNRLWSTWTYSSFIIMLIYWTAVCVFFELWGAVVIGIAALLWMVRSIFHQIPRS